MRFCACIDIEAKEDTDFKELSEIMKKTLNQTLEEYNVKILKIGDFGPLITPTDLFGRPLYGPINPNFNPYK